MRISFNFLFCLILIQSCQPNLKVDNKLLIDRIDRLSFNKTILEVSVDDYENVIDTLSIVKLKLNEDGITLYEIKESWYKDYKSIKSSYFRNNEDLFYQIFEIENNNFKTVYETFLGEDGEINRAQMINIESETTDTIFMKYNYKYNSEGKKESLSIITEPDTTNSVYYLRYNEVGKIDYKYQIYDNDTIEKSRAIFKNGKIYNYTSEFINPIEIELYTYDINENVNFRASYKEIEDSLVKTFEYEYEFDDLKEPKMTIIKDFENDTVIKRKFIIKTY